MNAIREALDLEPLEDLASTTCAWTDRLAEKLPFMAPSCEDQVAALREQDKISEADALERSCAEEK